MPEEFKNSKNNNHSHVGFVLKKTQVAIPMIIFEVIAFKKLPFKMFSVHTKTKSRRFQRYLYIEKFCFCDGLAWTVCLTVQIKLRSFRDGLVWTVCLTVQIAAPFRVGLVWTVCLTVQIKLRRFRDRLAWTVCLTTQIKLRFQIPLR